MSLPSRGRSLARAAALTIGLGACSDPCTPDAVLPYDSVPPPPSPILDAGPLGTRDADVVPDAAPDAEPRFGVELLVNGGFETSDVETGGLPTIPGRWRGDVAARVATDQGVVPHGGGQMLKFLATGPAGPAAAGYTCQQWQTVDLGAYAAEISAGKVRLDASVWYRRVAGDAGTDRRFDLRVLAFAGAPAAFPTSYPPPAPQIRARQLASTGVDWEKVEVTFEALPPDTRYVAVEIYPYEDVTDDANAEFDGHYADDASLVLTRVP